VSKEYIEMLERGYLGESYSSDKDLSNCSRGSFSYYLGEENYYEYVSGSDKEKVKRENNANIKE